MEEMYENWETPAVIPDMESELKLMRGNLRRRNRSLILRSTALALLILAVVATLVVPGLEKQYWDPTVCTYLENVTDLELTMVTYNELFGHGQHLVSVDIQKTGYADYSVDTVFARWSKMNMMADPSYRSAAVTRGKFSSGSDFWLDMVPGAFVQSNPVKTSEHQQFRNAEAGKTLKSLPDYIEVYASVTFPEDLTLDQLQQLTYQHYQNPDDIRFLWAPLRVCDPEEGKAMPCGIHLTEYRSERYSPSIWHDKGYPELFVQRYDWSGTDMEQHVKSMLKFLEDQLTAGQGILPPENEAPDYYERVLAYMEENGVKAYGSYVIARPEVLLKMMEDGVVSNIYLLDAWIGI